MRRDESLSYEALRRAHGDRVYRFCYRLCGHVEDAEDLAQDVLILAFRNLDRFEGRSAVTTWLYRIAFRRWGQIVAARRAPLLSLEDEWAKAPSADPYAGATDRLSLERAIEALSAPLREALLLVKIEGLKYREAAEVLGVPIGTVQWRVHDAIERLRISMAVEPTASCASGRKEGCRTVEEEGR